MKENTLNGIKSRAKYSETSNLKETIEKNINIYKKIEAINVVLYWTLLY